MKIGRKNLEKYAGVRRFRFGEAELEDLVGITTGLAWTEVGGELLQIEAVLVGRPGLAPHYQLVVTRRGHLDHLRIEVEALDYYGTRYSVTFWRYACA